jgi:hypothetical protein
MRTIGFRVEPAKVTFAVHDDGTIINLEVLKLPNALEVPDKLKYVRNNVLDILREYKVEKAVIRATESAAQIPNPARIQIEAVIQEAFASSHLNKYGVAQLVTIAKLNRIPHGDIKKYVSGELSIESADTWASYSDIQREAILCATGAVNV